MQRRSISALSVIRRGCRSPRRRMAMATATSAQAIRMGLRYRMPMAIRRAIRCGVRAGRFFNGRWRDKFLSSRAQKDAASRLNRDAAFFLLQEDAVDSCQFTVFSKRGTGSPRLAAFAQARKRLGPRFCPRPTRGRLLADDGNFGVRNFQAHEAVIAIEQEKNFEVGGGDFQAFIGLAVGTGGSGGLHGNRTRGQFLGNDHRKSLHAAFGPVIDAGEDGVLMVEIVVQNSNEGRIEREVLLERAGALHLESDSGHAVGEEDVRAVRFFRLGAPVITDRRSIALQRQRAGDFAGATLGRLDFRGAFGEPAAAGRSDFKFFVADGLSAEFDGELALILGEDNRAGRYRSLLLSR